VKSPDGLGGAGERAWREAIQAIEEQNAPDGRFEEAATRYAIAVDIAHAIRGEWEEIGSPKLEWGGATGKVKVAHPLIKAMSDANRDAARFAADLGLTPQARKKLGAIRGRPQERVPTKRKDSEPPKVVPLRKAG
jgi:P27 family predicted phage terminase small subunit